MKVLVNVWHKKRLNENYNMKTIQTRTITIGGPDWSIEKHVRPGDIILVMGNSLISKATRLQGDKVSHAMIYIGNNQVVEALYTKNIVAITNLKDAIANCITVVVRRPAAYYYRVGFEDRVCELAKKYVGLKYDRKQLYTTILYSLLAMIGIKWNWLIKNIKYKMICSELIDVVFNEALLSFDVPSEQVTPQFLLETDKLKTIVGIGNL